MEIQRADVNTLPHQPVVTCALMRSGLPSGERLHVEQRTLLGTFRWVGRVMLPALTSAESDGPRGRGAGLRPVAAQVYGR